jgi:hypothetical protein
MLSSRAKWIRLSAIIAVAILRASQADAQSCHIALGSSQGAVLWNEIGPGNTAICVGNRCITTSADSPVSRFDFSAEPGTILTASRKSGATNAICVHVVEPKAPSPSSPSLLADSIRSVITGLFGLFGGFIGAAFLSWQQTIRSREERSNNWLERYREKIAKFVADGAIDITPPSFPDVDAKGYALLVAKRARMDELLAAQDLRALTYVDRQALARKLSDILAC